MMMMMMVVVIIVKICGPEICAAEKSAYDAHMPCTRWFKYDWDYLCVNKSQFVPVIFVPPCICKEQISRTL